MSQIVTFKIQRSSSDLCAPYPPDPLEVDIAPHNANVVANAAFSLVNEFICPECPPRFVFSVPYAHCPATFHITTPMHKVVLNIEANSFAPFGSVTQLTGSVRLIRTSLSLPSNAGTYAEQS